MPFTERNLPPRQPAGPTIPAGVRNSIFTIMNDLGYSPTRLWDMLVLHQGYGSFQEVIEDLEERFTPEQAAHFRDEMNRAIQVERPMGRSADINVLAEPALRALPEALFLDAVELGFKEHGSYAGGFPQAREINELFERRGIFFRVDTWGRVGWVGDPGAFKEVTGPALAALQDARLAGARNEFEAARSHLRRGSSKDLEDAIEEAAKAVESTMKVLLDEHGVRRSGKETAFPLFELLRDNRIVEAEADQAVLGAARIRNEWGGHGAGAAARTPPASLAELAVQAAAAAIVFLDSRLN